MRGNRRGWYKRWAPCPTIASARITLHRLCRQGHADGLPPVPGEAIAAIRDQETDLEQHRNRGLAILLRHAAEARHTAGEFRSGRGEPSRRLARPRPDSSPDHEP